MDMSNWKLFSSLNLISTQPDQQLPGQHGHTIRIEDELELGEGLENLGDSKDILNKYLRTSEEHSTAIHNTKNNLTATVSIDSGGDISKYDVGSSLTTKLVDPVQHGSQHPKEVESCNISSRFTDSKCVVDKSKALPMTTVISRISDVDGEDMVEDICHLESFHPSASNNIFNADDISASYGACEQVEPAVSQKLLDTQSCHLSAEDAEQEYADLPKLYCGVCDISFTREDNLVRHLLLKKHWENISSHNQITAATLCTQHHNQLMRHSKFYCQCCNFTCVTHDSLISHLKSQQHREITLNLYGPLYCSVCNFLDYERDQLLEHCTSLAHVKAVITGCSIKEKQSNIKCIKCSKILQSAVKFRQHMNRHEKNRSSAKTSKCRYCEFTGKKSAVSNHIVRVHCNERLNHCDTCDRSFHYEYDLKKHYSTAKHFNNVLDSYKRKFNLTGGIFEVWKHGQTRMKCNFCPYTTMVLSQLQSHYITHHEESCPLSEDVAITGSNHDRRACRFCSCTVKLQDLSAHEVGHVQDLFEADWKEKEECPCFICYQTVSTTEIRDHIITQHTQTKVKPPLKCKNTETFPKKIAIEKPSDKTVRYHCRVDGCTRSYKTKADLNVHLASHGSLKKFVCEECEKSFATRKQLRAHTNTHRPLVMYNCDYCDYKCKTKVHLSRHTRIHAGSRPYTCPYCEYSSTTVGNLRKHIMSTKKHEGASMYQCTVSDCLFTSQTTRLLKQHLMQAHSILNEQVSVKSTQNDWIDVLEGHPIIPVQSRLTYH